MSKSKKTEEQDESCGSLDTGNMPAQSGKPARVNYENKPAPKSPEKKIHPRQQMPPIPEGEEVPDDSPSPPVDLD